MADCWIVVGVALLMIQMFFEPEPAAESESGDPALSADARRGTNG
jgi:hypothetical protein